MNRTLVTHHIPKNCSFKKNAVIWAESFREVVALDSNNHSGNTFDFILALDALTSIKTNDFQQLREYQTKLKDWCFGYFSYDVKNQLFNLESNNIDELEFPEMVFFQPKKIIEVKKGKAIFKYLSFCDDEIEEDFQAIINIKSEVSSQDKIHLNARTSIKKYEEGFNKAKKHIELGNTYELNYCLEFFAENTVLNPYTFYNDLNTKTKAPFASFLKWDKLFAMCASPERYIKNTQRKIISQPIKGTAKRGKTIEEDDQIKKSLQENKKERTENIMIVDLVRNDLSILAKPNTLKVEELCGIYSYPTVHQMISTVSCELDAGFVFPIDAVTKTFPMASMTGVPKKRTLEIIEDIEDHKRGLYSGSIGYFTPDSDFDFNVVIRSLLYNQKKKYISLSVGSAITFSANYTDEYNECLLKAKAIQDLLEQQA